MKKLIFVLIGVFVFAAGAAQADTATEEAVIKTINDANDYATKNLKGESDTVSKDGSLEFWSSGGFLQELSPGATQEEFDSINIDAKHIEVITLVPGKIAVAMYYSEGSMKPKDGPAVSNYRTRVTEVYVKEGGKWKTRAAHWSPIAGGAGTNQTAVDD